LIVLGHGDAEILDMTVKNKKVIGKRVGDVSPTDNYIIVSIYNNGSIEIPREDMILNKGSKVSVLVKIGAVKEVTKLFTS